MAVTYLMLARLPEGGLGAFDAYESAVLPLLAEYGGRLERRLRALDDQVEAHLVTFPNSEDLAATGRIPGALLLHHCWSRLGQRSNCLRCATCRDGANTGAVMVGGSGVRPSGESSVPAG